MFKQRVRSARRIAACGLLAVFMAVPAAAQAHDASVPPVKVDGNPKCADYGLTMIAKFDPVRSGTDGPVRLTKHHEYYVDWTSTAPVARVIVKGGPNASVYTYPAGTFGD